MKFANSIREITFGVEDGLVSILGLVAGVASANVSNKIVILAGVAGMLAAAISMSAGVYLSNKSQLEYLKTKFKNRKLQGISKNPLYDSIAIGTAFIIAGWIPLLPFFFITNGPAIITSFILTILALFIFGTYRSKYTKQDMVKSGLEMVFVSLLAAGAGYLVGYLFKMWFGV